MTQAQDLPLVVPSFTFRIEPADVERYRAALGASGSAVPLGMALRALTVPSVQKALREMCQGKLPVHLSQDYRLEQPIGVSFDYTCDVCLRVVGENRLHIEQRLTGPTGEVCLRLSSEIALVGP